MSTIVTAIAGRLFSGKVLAFVAVGAVLVGFTAGFALRDVICDAAYWKEEANKKQAVVDQLNKNIGVLEGRIEERDRTAANDAARAKADDAERAILVGALREVAFKIGNGSCFSATTIDWLRSQWPLRTGSGSGKDTPADPGRYPGRARK